MELDIALFIDHYRVYTCNRETRCRESCNSHVQSLGKPGVVKHSLDRIDVGIIAVYVVKPGRAVHPGIGGSNQNARNNTANANQHACGPMEPFIKPVPPVKEEPQRYSLYKKRHTL